VARWVNDHGGCLYVWTEAYGAVFGRARTATERPEGRLFTESDAVTEFALLIEDGARFGTKLRLSRPLFGLRDGVQADSGHFPVAGGP
jgi:hypothetical protein